MDNNYIYNIRKELVQIIINYLDEYSFNIISGILSKYPNIYKGITKEYEFSRNHTRIYKLFEYPLLRISEERLNGSILTFYQSGNIIKKVFILGSDPKNEISLMIPGSNLLIK